MTAPVSASLACVADDQAALFSSLRIMRSRMSSDRSGQKLKLEHFEDLSDHLLIVRPGSHLGRFRFEFCGATVAELGRSGDVAQALFSEVLCDDYTRTVLWGYRHVELIKLPHLSRNHCIDADAQRYCSRLILPLFANNRPALFLAAVAFHVGPLPGAGPMAGAGTDEL